LVALTATHDVVGAAVEEMLGECVTATPDWQSAANESHPIVEQKLGG
jgi:hypothetical protein